MPRRTFLIRGLWCAAAFVVAAFLNQVQMSPLGQRQLVLHVEPVDDIESRIVLCDVTGPEVNVSAYAYRAPRSLADTLSVGMELNPTLRPHVRIGLVNFMIQETLHAIHSAVHLGL